MLSKTLYKELNALKCAGLFFKEVSEYSTGFYGDRLKKAFRDREAMFTYVDQQPNKDKLRQLIASIDEDPKLNSLDHFNTAYQLKNNSREKILVDSSLLNNLETSKLELLERPFIQRQFIEAVNKALQNDKDRDQVKELSSFGICEELVWLWYCMDVVLNKDLLGRCNEICKRLSDGEKLTDDDKAFLDLFSRLGDRGKRTLVFENLQLLPNCLIEEHLLSCLPPPCITDLVTPNASKKECEDFSRQTIEDLKREGGLKFIRVGWKSSDSKNLVHVLGVSYTEGNNQGCFRLFDPNTGSSATSNALKAEKALAELLTAVTAKIANHSPKTQVYFKHSVNFSAKEEGDELQCSNIYKP